MKKFIKTHKNLSIAIGIFLVIFLIFFIVIFIAPLFKTNKYGDRLDNIDKYKVKSSIIKDVKDAVMENTGVSKVTYNKEGKILNFIITIDEDVNMEDAKKYANSITDNLSNKIKKYYDIEVFIDTKKDSDVYPIIGYHSKGDTDFTWSNVGEKSE